jgi:hypothetical protein
MLPAQTMIDRELVQARVMIQSAGTRGMTPISIAQRKARCGMHEVLNISAAAGARQVCVSTLSLVHRLSAVLHLIVNFILHSFVLT